MIYAVQQQMMTMTMSMTMKGGAGGRICSSGLEGPRDQGVREF